MKAAKHVLLLLLVLTLPLALVSAWVGNAQLPLTAVVDMAVLTNAVAKASPEAVQDQPNSIVADNEVRRLLWRDFDFADGACMLAALSAQSVKVWRSSPVILPSVELVAENAIAHDAYSLPARPAHSHLLL